MSFPAAEPVNMTQQDLIGFFNSVPYDGILHALTYTLFLIQEQWGKPWQEQTLQLSFRNKDSNFRVFRGRRRFAARNTGTMHLEDLPHLTAFMLQSSFFQCGNLLLNIGLCTAVRYADNRAFHFHEGLRRNPWTQLLLLNLVFYGLPILLEYVHEEKFLGTIC